MTVERSALEILEAALGYPPGPERDRAVATLCGADADLLTRVRALLAFEQAPLAAQPTEHFVQPLRVIDDVPARVGSYRITGEIARGGMGAVLRAERDDGVFEQTVAIKLIRADLASPEARARFADERRILARLRHPGIVRILDGGDLDGRPWLAMDLVEGEPVTVALERAAATRPARLDAFEAICEAVAYAHRNLVVHADIKPSNVLLDREGRIRLLDFGIARLVADVEADAVAARYPLTRDFAAPERAAGAVPSIAGDVFSLGVLLLHVLGVQQGPGDDRRRVPGSRLAEGLLEGDLAAIAARALAVDPDERYADVAELLADIRRHRAWMPVIARRDAGWRYAAGRFVVRHRRSLAFIGLAGVALLSAAVFSTTQYLRAERERDEAARRFDEVRHVARFMLTDLGDAMADAPGTVEARAAMAQLASRYLDRLRAVPGAPAALRLETAEGYRRLAALQGMPGVASLGRPGAAQESLDRAEALLDGVLREAPDDPAALEEKGWLLASRWTFAPDTAAAAVLHTEAADHFARAHAAAGAPGARLGQLVVAKNRGHDLIWQNQAGAALPGLAEALAALRAEPFPAELNREALLLEVSLLNRLGDARYYTADMAGALAAYREAEALISAQLEHGDAVIWVDRLGEARYNVGSTLAELPGRAEEALAVVRDGTAALRRVLAFGPDASIEKRLLILLGQEALLLRALGRPADAAAVSAQGLALRRARLAREPADPQHRRDLAVALPGHAELLADLGDRAAACAAAGEGLMAWESLETEGLLGGRDAAIDLPAARAAAERHCAAMER